MTSGSPPERPTRTALPPNDGTGDAVVPWNIWRVLGVAAFLAMALFWIWIFARGRGVAHPDELAVPAGDSAAELAAATDEELSAREFLIGVEAICAEAQAEIAQIPSAAAASSFDGRASLIDEATARLAIMIDDMEAVAKPTDSEAHFIATEWLADYDRFLDDRRRHTTILRSGEDPPFEISARDGRRLTNYIVTFAEVNRINSCIPPGDVG